VRGRALRLLAPNLVTAASLVVALWSVRASLEASHATAAWLIVLCVLLDKADGTVARLVHGTSDFGVQFDSLADFVGFGIAPAVLWYTFLTRLPGQWYATGGGALALGAASALWVLAAAFRLARFNATVEEPSCQRIFFGVPTTLGAAVLVSLFLTLLKYGDQAARTLASAHFGEPRLLGGLEVGPRVWTPWVGCVLVVAFLMVSTLRLPKVGRARRRWLTALLFVNLALGYAFGVARLFPEYLCTVVMVGLAVALVWGQWAPSVRGLRPPPLVPPSEGGGSGPRVPR
jgi:CDP-diacylglycerol--serine O-phosphatidyltransferase